MKKNLMALLSVLFFVEMSPAQTLLLQNIPTKSAQCGIRFMHPYFAKDIDISTFSGIYDLSLNVPLNSSINFTGTLPIISHEIDDKEKETEIGNIFLGIQTKHNITARRGSMLSFGLYLPTISDDNSVTNNFGSLTNFLEFSKFSANALTLMGNYGYYTKRDKRALIKFEISPNIVIPTKNDAETELYVRYGVNVGFEFSRLVIFSELAALVLISEDVDEFSDRFYHAMAFGTQMTRTRIRPGIFYMFYIDEDMKDMIDGVVAFKCDFSLK